MGIGRILLVASAAFSFLVSPLCGEDANTPIVPALTNTPIPGYIDPDATWHPGPVTEIPIGTEILWANQDGRVASWEMIGTNLIWKIRHTVPPSRFAIPRILLGSSYSSFYFQQANLLFVGDSPILARTFPGNILPFAAAGNFVGGFGSDLMWASATRIIVWELIGNRVSREHDVYNISALPADARLHGIGRFNMDGWRDFAWQDPRGIVWVTMMDGLRIRQVHPLNHGKPVNSNWKLRGVSDFNFDGHSDLLWLSNDRRTGVWFMNGTTKIGSTLLRGGQPVAPGWEIVEAKPAFVRPPLNVGGRPIVPGQPMPPSFPGVTNIYPTLPGFTNYPPIRL